MAQHGADTDTGPHVMRVLTSSPCPIITRHTVMVFYYQHLSLDRRNQENLPYLWRWLLHGSGLSMWVELIYSIINQNREKIVTLTGPKQN